MTVGLGQDSVDPQVLDERASALQRSVSGDGDPAAVVVVDVIKAAIQLVLAVPADDALSAARAALQTAEQGLQLAALDRPHSIAVVEAEAVTAPVADVPLRPHTVADAEALP